MARLPSISASTARKLVQVAILLVILGAIGTVGFIEYSAQPSFCLNCHNMRPYYESWATSTHNEVPCIECHYAPGIKAEAMGKLQAANQVVKYVTGAYGTRPWAEIEDAACLRSGCHSERKLEGEQNYRGVRFDHTHHLTELRRGKQLRCTSCHSQIVQGEHLTVTGSTCYLCHFKDRPPGDPVAGCTGCHANPPRIVSDAGFVVDHPQYVRDLVSCVSCHENVVQGSGAADRSRCLVCHNEPERLERYDETTLLHRVHLAEHNLECAQCHREMSHEIVSLAETVQLDCASCHRGSHEAQRRLYSGTGGHGTTEMPSSMFLARVSCSSCHAIPEDMPGHEQVRGAGEATCLSCHGIGYAGILPGWQAELEQRTRRVEGVVEAAAAAPASDAERRDSLLALARENVELVRVGRGAHNVGFADRLLRSAVGFVEEAVERAGLRYDVPRLGLGEVAAGSRCSTCHLGIGRQAGEWRGRRFDHAPHVERAGLDCAFCHTGLDDHGGIRLEGTAACDDCHHSRTARDACVRCHENAAGAPTEPVSLPGGEFRHPLHVDAGLPCGSCHAPPSMDASGVECGSCHAAHHQPEAECLACHRGGAVIGFHPAAVHQMECSACHGDAAAGLGEWTRQVCTVCHSDRTAHYAPTPCVDCHGVPSAPSE